ncbi:MAG: FtsW/RodA/SpoVE family cell cycle protein [Lachnospiraceae bacterium]|nr:FtsW/RodA/SpoVE family cell cycle protein [Lachnospiraceae bacterium]
MERIIIEISRYLMIICMAVYTIQCFAVFRFGNEYDRKGIYLRQNFFMVMIHFAGFLSLYAQLGDIKYFKAYLIQQIGILAILISYRFLYPRANILIINNMCMLLTIGLLILTRISYNKAMRQFYIVMGSVAVTMIVPLIISRIRFFEKFKWLYVGIGVASLAAVLLFSTVINGSKINITISSYTFQPSEYVKIIFVFAIASILARDHHLKAVIISAVVALLHVLLLVASKDLGSAIIFFIVYFSMLYAATRNVLYYAIGLLAGAAGAYGGYRLFSHVRVRVTAFLDPIGNITDAGYQIAQSLFAIGTGGWLGMGIGQGAPSTIPVVAADFIFSAICEEMGVVFGMCLVLLCLSCFVMFMNIAMKFEDPFFKLVALGLSVAYIFQVFLTIGGVIKFIPLTGVTLPLVSYGGTSVAVTCCVFAVIQGLYISKGRDNKPHTPTPADFATEKLDIVELD